MRKFIGTYKEIYSEINSKVEELKRKIENGNYDIKLLNIIEGMINIEDNKIMEIKDRMKMMNSVIELNKYRIEIRAIRIHYFMN